MESHQNAPLRIYHIAINLESEGVCSEGSVAPCRGRMSGLPERYSEATEIALEMIQNDE